VTRLSVALAVADAHPGYRAEVLVAAGVENGPSDARSRAILRAAEARARELLAGRAPAELPRIAAWRAAFGAAGLKPSRFPSSVWVDDAGVTCRAWNWRQGVRTRIREDTRRAVFLLEAIDDGAAADLPAAAAELEAHLDAVGAGGTRLPYGLP
jgi:DNA/RNA-binding domain of Phe-tRNA-synthetase-like protein